MPEYKKGRNLAVPPFRWGRKHRSHAGQPVVHVALHLVACIAVVLLEEPFELIAIAVDRGQVVISELAPLLLDLALEFLLIAFNAIPVHGSDPS